MLYKSIEYSYMNPGLLHCSHMNMRCGSSNLLTGSMKTSSDHAAWPGMPPDWV